METCQPSEPLLDTPLQLSERAHIEPCHPQAPITPWWRGGEAGRVITRPLSISVGLHEVGTREAATGLLLRAPIKMTSRLGVWPSRKTPAKPPNLHHPQKQTVNTLQHLRALLQLQPPQAASWFDFEPA